jgi:hypothetical protein
MISPNGSDRLSIRAAPPAWGTTVPDLSQRHTTHRPSQKVLPGGPSLPIPTAAIPPRPATAEPLANTGRTGRGPPAARFACTRHASSPTREGRGVLATWSRCSHKRCRGGGGLSRSEPGWCQRSIRGEGSGFGRGRTHGAQHPLVAVTPNGPALGGTERITVPCLVVDLRALVAIHAVLADQADDARRKRCWSTKRVNK